MVKEMTAHTKRRSESAAILGVSVGLRTSTILILLQISYIDNGLPAKTIRTQVLVCCICFP